jgi:hypothetical protein
VAFRGRRNGQDSGDEPKTACISAWVFLQERKSRMHIFQTTRIRHNENSETGTKFQDNAQNVSISAAEACRTAKHK